MGYFREAFCPCFKTISGAKALKWICVFICAKMNMRVKLISVVKRVLGQDLFWKEEEKVKMAFWEQMFCFNSSPPCYMWRWAAVCNSVLHCQLANLVVSGVEIFYKDWRKGTCVHSVRWRTLEIHYRKVCTFNFVFKLPKLYSVLNIGSVVAFLQSLSDICRS